MGIVSFKDWLSWDTTSPWKEKIERPRNAERRRRRRRRRIYIYRERKFCKRIFTFNLTPQPIIKWRKLKFLSEFLWNQGQNGNINVLLRKKRSLKEGCYFEHLLTVVTSGVMANQKPNRLVCVISIVMLSFFLLCQIPSAKAGRKFCSFFYFH